MNVQAIVISYFSEPFKLAGFSGKLTIFVLMAWEKCSKLVLHVDLNAIVLNLSMMTSIRHLHYFTYSRANAAILSLLLGNKKPDFLIFWPFYPLYTL